MTTENVKIIKEIEFLKNKVIELQNELAFLKDNYRALGYISDDSILTEEEKRNLEEIDELVEKDQLENLFELK